MLLFIGSKTRPFGELRISEGVRTTAGYSALDGNPYHEKHDLHGCEISETQSPQGSHMQLQSPLHYRNFCKLQQGCNGCLDAAQLMEMH